ncbi:MAG: 50S ribosomal protein L25/general stress protein Ctc [Proteobacteria bacterium]|jgi:large subunit ribosomal protein L25|nr:50S ribosomal protein L25/general stress protein Ctc [Pseudomonadota bacterium]
MSITINANLRNEIGKSFAKKLKKQGLIPAIIYNKDGNINLSIDSHQFLSEYKKGNSTTTVFDLKISDNENYRVIPYKIELDPVSDFPIHIDFIFCNANKPIIAQAKINFTNVDRSPGLKRGGFLHVVARKVQLICEEEKNIPTHIEADVVSLHVGGKFRSSQLKIPAGCKLAKKSNFLIASIIGRGKSEDDKTTATADSTAKSEDKKTEVKKTEAKK